MCLISAEITANVYLHTDLHYDSLKKGCLMLLMQIILEKESMLKKES